MKTDTKNEPIRTDLCPAQARQSLNSGHTFPPTSTALRIPCHELPKQMIVAIDGWAQTGKNTSGELVAEAIDGVLVDSGRFYRAMTQACLNAAVDLGNPAAVIRFCRETTIEVRLGRDGGKVDEALVGVNGEWFGKAELQRVGAETPKVARLPAVREVVNAALRLCAGHGRVVMLGRDIGGVVFPETPFKYFLDAAEDIREQRHLRSTQTQGAVQRDRQDQKQTAFAVDALLIDTGKLEPAEVRAVIMHSLLCRTAEQQKRATG